MQYDPPSPYMRGPPQPKSRTQGESDHDSRPDSDQKTTGVQDDDRGIPIPIRQFLGRQEVGKFDFGREFGIIKNQDEFKHRLEEYEAMNNEPKSCTDFPTDHKTQREFALKIAKAIVNVDRAIDATNNKTVAQRKAEENQHEQDRGGEEPGGLTGSTAHSGPPKDEASNAVNHLNRLKTAEVEIMSWKVMLAAYDAQGGELSQGKWGNVDIPQPEDFDSWRERIETIIELLNTSKDVCRQLFRKGQRHLEQLVASPGAMWKRHDRYKKYNDKRSEGIVQKGEEERRLAASRQLNSTQSLAPPLALTPGFADLLTRENAEGFGSPYARDGTGREVNAVFSSPSAQKPPSAVLKPSSSGSTTTQNAPSTQIFPASADASPTTESKAKQQPHPSTFNEFTPDSVGREFAPPVLTTRPSSEDNQRPGQSSRAATSGPSAFTSSPPSAPQRPQASGFLSYPVGVPFQGGTAGASDTQSSANKRSRLSSEPQEDYSPGTRGAGASSSPKRHKGYPTRGGSDLNADDVEREENDDHDNKQEE